MIYSLKCGNCLQNNNVSASNQPISWICDNCSNENSTSLPVTVNDVLVTDASKAAAILTPAQAASATNVIEGEVI